MTISGERLTWSLARTSIWHDETSPSGADPARAAVPPNFEGEDEHQADLDDLADPTVQLYSSSQCSEASAVRGRKKSADTANTAINQVGNWRRWWEFQRARGHGTLTERTTTRWRFPRC